MKPVARSEPVDPGSMIPSGLASPVAEAVNVLRRRSGTVLASVLVLTSLATLAGFVLPPRFTAMATVMIDSRQTRVVDMEQVLPDLPSGQETLDTELSLVKTRPLAVRVMNELGLFDEPKPRHAWLPAWLAPTTPARAEGAWPSKAVDALVASTRELADRLTGVRRDDAPAPQAEPDSASEAPATSAERELMIDDFLDSVQVRQVGGAYSRLISVSFSAPDPAEAAKVVNRLAAVYAESQLELKRAVTGRANAWLDERLRAMQDEVLQAEHVVATFRAEHQLNEVRGAALGGEQLAELNRELIQVRSDVAAKAAKLSKIRELRASARDLSSLTDVMSSPVVEALRKDQAELERQQGEFAAQYGERHPRMLALHESKAKVARRVQEEIDRIVLGLEDDLAVTQTREQSIGRDLELSRAAYVAQSQAEVRLRELDREAAAKRDLYRTLLTRYQEVKTQEGLLVPDARVVSSAGVPPLPSTPSPAVFGVVGFTFSVVAGAMLALVRERLDERARSSRQLEDLFSLPVLGLVPKIKRRRGQPLHAQLLQRPRSHYSEVASILCRSALAGGVDHRSSKVVLVTSALPNEGKTSLAACLAVRGAKLGKRTILVDLDLRRPAIAREFGLRPSSDVVDGSLGEDRLGATIVRDEATGVDVLPAKPGKDNIADFLMSPRLHSLLETLRGRYDYVVLDSPPVLGLVDAQILSKHADLVILAVCWARTRTTAVDAGLKALREVDAELAGIVLTQVDVKKYAKARYGDAAEYYQDYRGYYLN